MVNFVQVNKIRQIFKNNQIIFFGLLFLIVFLFGIKGKINYVTDDSSEELLLQEAKLITECNHRYGIVHYTHYPNGPLYILLPFILCGIRNSNILRMVPLSISALAISLFFFYFLKKSKSQLNVIFILLLFISIILQPGIVNWMAALHEHSYQMSMVFLIILIGYIVQDSKDIFFTLGFLCGWIGYDFIPAQILSMMIVRYVKYSQRNDSVISSLILSFRDTLFGVLGVVLAVATHFIQNALYFGSFKKAFIDLFGAAEARIFLDKGKNLDPDYIKVLKAANNFNQFPSRFFILRKMFNKFVLHGWSRPIVIILSLWIGSVFNVITVYQNKLSRKKYLLNLIIISIMSISASIAWFIFMKYHAAFHYHFLPRLFFVGYINLLVFMIISNEKVSSEDPKRLNGHLLKPMESA